MTQCWQVPNGVTSWRQKADGGGGARGAGFRASGFQDDDHEDMWWGCLRIMNVFNITELYT